MHSRLWLVFEMLLNVRIRVTVCTSMLNIAAYWVVLANYIHMNVIVNRLGYSVSLFADFGAVYCQTCSLVRYRCYKCFHLTVGSAFQWFGRQCLGQALFQAGLPICNCWRSALPTCAMGAPWISIWCKFIYILTGMWCNFLTTPGQANIYEKNPWV